ncbi:SDR family oxidoreductase [Geobacter sp. DSM 9736]|uniref:SDR family oxidoreductase n=1 Tax=Geobacter sp. DSM 9736 TaxID=1277350 RepID=UPI000B5EE5E8|nr:SDR family oxidoreductase [Geobacter sp. DSM 9736]SNB45044.1 3-oxoacyl-[acyl-carrier protein] reductase [Geobacter sp. DSM 9736]
MELGLKGRCALVGGGSKGLGKACAMQLAREGVNVAICARSPQILESAAAEIRAASGAKILPIQADLSNLEDVNRTVAQTLEEFGRVDVLIVNSGGPRPGKFGDLSREDWDAAYRSVLYYAVELYRLVIPQMRENKWGRIINIASATVKEPSETLLLSNVFRTGLVSLAKTLSRDLIKDNVTINTICPAAFRTDRAIQLMTEQANSQGISIQEVEQKIVEGLPLQRFNAPEELANLALYLCSNLALGITGTTIQVDGGLQKFIF